MGNGTLDDLNSNRPERCVTGGLEEMCNTQDLEIGRKLLVTLPLIVRTIAADLKQQEAETGLTFAQFFALNALSRQDYPMNELSSHLAVSPSTATGLVDRLVAKDLVERFADPTDRRVVKLRLSGDGKELLSRVQGKVDNQAARLVAQFGEEQKVTLGAILATLQAALQNLT